MVNGIITIRSQSTRLPEKCFLEFGQGNVLEHLIKRTRYFSINPIISTSDNPLDDRIEGIANKHGVKCFRGSEIDKIERWRDTCRDFELESFVTIDGDDLFFDGALIEKSHFSLINKGYDMVMHPITQPYHGCVGYAIRASVLDKVCEQKETNVTDNHWEFIQQISDARYDRLESVGLSENKIRLTLDYQEDYWLLRTILRLLDYNASMNQILDLFSSNPDLYKINWFRTDDYLQGTGGMI